MGKSRRTREDGVIYIRWPQKSCCGGQRLVCIQIGRKVLSKRILANGYLEDLLYDPRRERHVCVLVVGQAARDLRGEEANEVDGGEDAVDEGDIVELVRERLEQPVGLERKELDLDVRCRSGQSLGQRLRVDEPGF